MGVCMRCKDHQCLMLHKQCFQFYFGGINCSRLCNMTAEIYISLPLFPTLYIPLQKNKTLSAIFCCFRCYRAVAYFVFDTLVVVVCLLCPLFCGDSKDTFSYPPSKTYNDQQHFRGDL